MPPKSYLEKVIVFLSSLASAGLFSSRLLYFWSMFLMLEKSKVVYLWLTICYEDSPSAWKLRVASVEAILDSLFLRGSSLAMGNPVPECLKKFLGAWAVLKYLSLERELVFLMLLFWLGRTKW